MDPPQNLLTVLPTTTTTPTARPTRSRLMDLPMMTTTRPMVLVTRNRRTTLPTTTTRVRRTTRIAMDPATRVHPTMMTSLMAQRTRMARRTTRITTDPATRVRPTMDPPTMMTALMARRTRMDRQTTRITMVLPMLENIPLPLLLLTTMAPPTPLRVIKRI